MPWPAADRFCLSGAAGDEDSAGPGQRDEHRGHLAGAAYVDCRVLADVRKNLRSAPVLMGLAGLLGGTAGAVVLLNTPQKTFMRLVPWLLLFAACTFAVSGPVARALERLKLERRTQASAG